MSGDNTVATWGGSTADNLESIEEDENDSGAGQDAEEVDDGKLLNPVSIAFIKCKQLRGYIHIQICFNVYM